MVKTTFSQSQSLSYPRNFTVFDYISIKTSLSLLFQVCTKGKQHIMKYLSITAIREDKARMGMLNEMDMKRFRKSLPSAQSVYVTVLVKG